MSKLIKKDFELKPFYNKVEFPFRVQSRVVMNEDQIGVSFHLTGSLGLITMPAIKEDPSRVIGLWNNTCFEFFLKNKYSDEYLEFNFSPSLDWNCFHFVKDSNDLKEWKLIHDAHIEIESTPTAYNIITKINKKRLPAGLSIPAELAFSTTAVIIYDDNTSYWAIRHSDNEPNFHHKESFESLL